MREVDDLQKFSEILLDIGADKDQYVAAVKEAIATDYMRDNLMTDKTYRAPKIKEDASDQVELLEAKIDSVRDALKTTKKQKKKSKSQYGLLGSYTDHNTVNVLFFGKIFVELRRHAGGRGKTIHRENQGLAEGLENT